MLQQTLRAQQPQTSFAQRAGRGRNGSRGLSRPWAASALLAMVVIAYLPALQGDFVWDDETNVINNATLRSWDGLRQMWLEPRSVQQYYPLMYTSYWLEYRLWGLAPLGYHITNILLHAAAVVLLWRLLARLNVPGSWFAAAMFAVHPVTVESVAWITERKNVLSLSLALLSMLCYLRFSPPDCAADAGPFRAAAWRWYWLARLFFALCAVRKDGRGYAAGSFAGRVLVATRTDHCG